MPKSETVSKGGKSVTKAVLFAYERRHLREAIFILEWLAEHTNSHVGQLAVDAQVALKEVVFHFPEPEKTAKPEKAAK